jgi:hypothetical protein
MTNRPQGRERVVIAAIAASFLMLIFGLTYRALAAGVSAPLSKTPIDPAALEPFPMQIADWTGEDIPLDEAEVIMGKIHAEASINRRYSRANGAKAVSLFIAASGTTAGTLVGHLPEICNVMAGSTLTDQRSVELPLKDATKLPCSILQFSRSRPLDGEKKTVLYYYMADSRFYGKYSQLRWQVRRGPTMVHCIAQVQIVASSTNQGSADGTTALVSQFAADSASAVVEMFQRIEESQRSRESRKAPKES